MRRRTVYNERKINEVEILFLRKWMRQKWTLFLLLNLGAAGILLMMLILLAFNIDLFTYLIRISVSHMPERRAQSDQGPEANRVWVCLRSVKYGESSKKGRWVYQLPLIFLKWTVIYKWKWLFLSFKYIFILKKREGMIIDSHLCFPPRGNLIRTGCILLWTLQHIHTHVYILTNIQACVTSSC